MVESTLSLLSSSPNLQIPHLVEGDDSDPGVTETLSLLLPGLGCTGVFFGPVLLPLLSPSLCLTCVAAVGKLWGKLTVKTIRRLKSLEGRRWGVASEGNFQGRCCKCLGESVCPGDCFRGAGLSPQAGCSKNTFSPSSLLMEKGHGGVLPTMDSPLSSHN